MSFSRREFLALGGTAGGASAFLLTGCEKTENLKYLYATLTPEEEMRLGQEVWYATTCAECPAGCGLLVRTIEGRAKKIEGNPLHPVNRGKTCARAQAAVQGLYDPDRHQGPLVRSGRRAGGRTGAQESVAFSPTSWDEALGAIAPQLGPQTLLISSPQRGQMHWLLASFMKSLDSDYLYYLQMLSTGRLRRACRAVYGYETLASFDLARADLIVSFGAGFLETRSYGQFRRGEAADDRSKMSGRGRLIVLEPRLSTTAAAADQWIPIRPGTEGVLALALANLLGPPREAQELLNAYTPASVAERCGVRPKQIDRLAAQLSSARAPLVLGGGMAEGTTNGTFNMVAVQMLNRLLMDQGKDVPVRPAAASPLTTIERFKEIGDGTDGTYEEGTFAKLETLGQQILSAAQPPVRTLLVHGIDLLKCLPHASAFRQALERIPLIVSFSSWPDETSHLADWILPDHTPLESWGDDITPPGLGEPILGLFQPAVPVRYDTRATGDVLIKLAEQRGKNFYTGSYRRLLEENVEALYRLNKQRLGNLSSESFEQSVLAKGGWFEIPQFEAWAGPATKEAPGTLAKLAMEDLTEQEAVFDGDSRQFPFIFLVYPSMHLSEGTGANRPWLQEAGDPMTTIAWGSWLEINPNVASSMGVSEGDLVEVESPAGKVVLPVYPYPGIGPEVVAAPLGQGHDASGRYAKGRGANILAILSPQTDAQTGDLAWIATRVRLRRLGKRTSLIKYEGSGRELEGAQRQLEMESPYVQMGIRATKEPRT